MKSMLMAAVAALTLAACGGSETSAPTATGETPVAATAAPAAAPAGPSGPIAGRWEVSVSAAGMTVAPTEICYERQITMEEAQKMQQQAGITCSEETYAADGKSGHSVCTMSDMKITSDYNVTGDFSSAYTMEMTSSIDPAMPGMPNPSTTTIAMKRLGDCTADTPRAPMP